MTERGRAKQRGTHDQEQDRTSKMSRLYDDQPLQSIPVNTHELTTVWDPSNQQKGPGVILEGAIEGRSRHVIIDKGQTKLRYLVLHVRPSQAHRRKFDATGKEMEPNFSQTRKVNTGYLHSSYKVEARGESDRLSSAELEHVVTSANLIHLTQQHHRQGCLPFWIPEAEVQGMDLRTKDHVRLKTKGDGPFIYNVAQLDRETSQVSNFAGGDMVGASWTDKVMAVKRDQMEREEDNQGVEEDEWDD